MLENMGNEKEAKISVIENNLEKSSYYEFKHDIDEEERSAIFEKSPLERIGNVRNNLLDKLTKGQFDNFKADNFLQQDNGVFGGVYVYDKSELLLVADSVLKAGENGEILRTEKKIDENEEEVKAYKEKIILTEKQVNNFISLIEKNIIVSENEIKDSDSNQIQAAMAENIEQLKETIEILKTGGADENYDPRIVLSSE